MTETGADMHTITLEQGLATFLNGLSGKNRSAATIRAYQTDIQQFIAFLHANNVSIQIPADVEKVDIVEYLSALAKRELTGIARARKMSAALHLTVVQLTCNETGGPTYSSWQASTPSQEDYHGPHNHILPQLELLCQRPNGPGQYRDPFAQGTAVHLSRVSEDLQRYKRHGLLSAAHFGRDRGARRDLARPWVSRASDCGGVWVRRADHSGLVGPFGPSGPRRAPVPSRATTRPGTGPSR